MNKHLLILSNLLVLLSILSCGKEEASHPLVGSWVRHSLSYTWGNEFQRLTFYNEDTGELITEATQYCVDDISVLSGEIITNCTSFNYEGGLYKRKYNFSWKTEGNLLTRMYESEQQEVITLETSTETTENLLNDFEENVIFIVEDIFTKKGTFYF